MDLLNAPWQVRAISRDEACAFVDSHHYAKHTPSTSKVAYGLFVETAPGDFTLMGVCVWGYGVRPRHTIEKWMPGFTTADYLELNRLCLSNEMPRNSESKFLSLVCAVIKRDCPAVKVLLSWADGLRGKPGYVYQACSWLYGGFIWSDFYTNQGGEVIHPRLLITRLGSRGKEVQRQLDLNSYRGKQFMYCHFLCSKTEKKHALKRSPFAWNREYPKGRDIIFTCARAGGERLPVEGTPHFVARRGNLSLGVLT